MVMMHIFLARLQAGIELVTILVALNDEPVNLNLLDNIDCSASVFSKCRGKRGWFGITCSGIDRAALSHVKKVDALAAAPTARFGKSEFMQQAYC
jgi:hypothetical protein